MDTDKKRGRLSTAPERYDQTTWSLVVEAFSSRRTVRAVADHQHQRTAAVSREVAQSILPVSVGESAAHEDIPGERRRAARNRSQDLGEKHDICRARRNAT